MTYPRDRNRAVKRVEERMRAVRPDYRMPLIDFWDPVLADQLDNVRRSARGGWIAGEIAGYTARYRRSGLRGISVDLEVLDADTGRRLRQDGSDSEALIRRLEQAFDSDQDDG